MTNRANATRSPYTPKFEDLEGRALLSSSLPLGAAGVGSLPPAAIHAEAKAIVPNTFRITSMSKVETPGGFVAVALTFNQPVSVSSATELDAYNFFQVTYPSRFAPPTETELAVQSVTISAHDRKVVVGLSTPVITRDDVVFTAYGELLLSSSGAELDGSGRGYPGSNYVRGFFPF